MQRHCQSPIQNKRGAGIRERKKAWVISVDMGYGHQRAAWPLKPIAEGGRVISANNYPGIPMSDKRVWRDTRRLYDLISRFKQVPLIGDAAFGLFDRFQNIRDFYPKIQRREPTLQVRQIYRLFEKRQWGKHLIKKLGEKKLPLVTTFFAVGFMAEYWKYKEPIYVVVTDTDVSRAWAPLHPKKTRIIYCAPTSRVVERLQSYGIPASNIVLTGFPLPQELLGIPASQDLKRRLVRLDPAGSYRALYSSIISKYVGKIAQKSSASVSITFAIGGAGAQKELGREILFGLAPLIRKRKVTLNLIAGIHSNLAEYFEGAVKEARLKKGVGIMSAPTKREYFLKFNRLMRSTDVLWTKPSELVFYAALGIPIITAPPIGSQEIQNRKWLMESGAGIQQLDPRFVHQWFCDMLEKGLLTEAAMQGYVELEKQGTRNVIKTVLQKS